MKSETSLQASCFKWAWNTHPETRRCLFSVPNGGSRNVIEATQLKAAGLVPGEPDLILVWAGTAHGFEAKVGNNPTSDDQDLVHAAWRAQGLNVWVFRSLEQFQEIFESILAKAASHVNGAKIGQTERKYDERIKYAVDISKKQIVLDGCMVAFSGAVIDLFNPDPQLIMPEDIAHGLAFTCRWNGSTKTFYSVAEHCCMMADMAPDHLKLTALMHDCEEAYWGDIIKPLKNLLPGSIREHMRNMRHLIFKKFNVHPIGQEIEALDARLLEWDFKNLILDRKHEGWECYRAEMEWRSRFHILTGRKYFVPSMDAVL